MSGWRLAGESKVRSTIVSRTKRRFPESELHAPGQRHVPRETPVHDAASVEPDVNADRMRIGVGMLHPERQFQRGRGGEGHSDGMAAGLCAAGDALHRLVEAVLIWSLESFRKKRWP